MLEEFVPERALLPIGGETQMGQEFGLEGDKMMAEAVGPVGVGFDNADHVDQQDEGVIDQAVGGWVQVWNDGSGGALGELDSDGEAAVPKARMVGAEITNV